MKTIEEVKTAVIKKGVPKEQVEELTNSQVKDMDDMFKDLTPEEREERKAKRLISFFRKIVHSDAKLREVLVLLDNGIQVANRVKINQVLDLAQDTMVKEELLVSGELVDTAQGLKVCDMRKEFAGGKTNPNYGRPLVERQFRMLSGVFMQDNLKKHFDLTLNGDNVKLKLPESKAFKAYVEERTGDDGRIFLKMLPGTNFIMTDYSWNITKELEELYKDKKIDLRDFDNVIQNANKEGRRFETYLIEGEFYESNLDGEKPSIKIQDVGGLDDKPISIHIKLSEDLLEEARMIAPNSMVKVAGSIWSMDSNDESGEPFRGMTAMSLIYDTRRVETETVKEEDINPEDEFM